MWSIEDEVACHKRRYSKVEMLSKLKKAGFDIKYHTSFVFSLFPLMIVSRFLKRNKKLTDLKNNYSNEELKLNPLINNLFELILKLDELLIRIGVRLPFGGSLIDLNLRIGAGTALSSAIDFEIIRAVFEKILNEGDVIHLLKIPSSPRYVVRAYQEIVTV